MTFKFNRSVYQPVGLMAPEPDIISQQDMPMIPHCKELALEAVETDSRAAAARFSDGLVRDLTETGVQRDQTKSKLEHQRTAQKEAEEKMKQAGPGRLILATLFVLCAVSCFVAEFELTWVTLPFILNITPTSFLGLMLGIAPATALIILDVVLDRLIEGPWQTIREALKASTTRRVGAIAIMALFLLGLGVANIHTVILLAQAREEVARFRHELNAEDETAEPTLDRASIDRAILAVSVVVTLDGALFFLLGTRGFRRAFDRRRCVRNLKRQNSEVTSLEAKLSETEARFSELEHVMNQLEERKSLVAEQYRKRTLLNIEKADNAWRSSRRSDELVSEILSVNYRNHSAADETGKQTSSQPKLMKLAQGTAS